MVAGETRAGRQTIVTASERGRHEGGEGVRITGTETNGMKAPLV